MTLIDTALAADTAGIAVLPVRTDGTKAPAANWKDYQTARPTLDQLIAWFDTGHTDGIGFITGAISGGLEMLEAEGRAVEDGTWERFSDLCIDHGIDTLGLIWEGYAEQTPSGGIHLLYRVSDGPTRGNTKLARRRDENGRIEVLLETRGEGGFVVTAPSAGRTHPTGQPWKMLAGGVNTIATITSEERDTLFAIATMLDEMPAQVDPTPRPARNGITDGLRPGDDYNNKADWADILDGWQRVRRMGNGYGWRKPGSHDPGIHATTGQATDGVDRLYVFSTATEFDPETPYTKFAAYAVLHHSGDYAAAARELGAQGYGTQSQITRNPPALGTLGPTAQAAAPAPQQATTVQAPPAQTLTYSEDGVASMLVNEYGGVIRYCTDMGKWLYWTGTVWATQPLGGGMVRELVKGIGRTLPETNREEVGHKKRILSASGVAAVVALAATDPVITVRMDELDTRTWELNTPAGIIDLHTGALGPANPASLHTKITAVAPDPTAPRTAWTQFLSTTFSGNDTMIGFIQRLLGYACVGEVRESVLPVFFGEGANGKTVLLETVADILGDYATSVGQKFLVQGPPQHPTEVAALAGKRLVIASETNEGEKFDEAKVKLLTGGDRLKARFMRMDEFTFIPSHTLIQLTNHQPEVTSGGAGFWRRVRLVPFDHQMPREKRDPELKQRLVRDHGPAILAWLAEGAAQYAQHALGEPEGVRAATQEYEQSTDTVGQFIADMVILGGGDAVQVKTSIVRDAYEKYCADEGMTPVTAKALTTYLAKRGVGKTRDKHSRYYTGITILSSPVTDGPALDGWGSR